MQIELNIPDPLIRKIRALNILVQGTADIERLIVSLIETTVNDAIIGHLGDNEPDYQPALVPERKSSQQKRQAQNQASETFDRAMEFDATGISDGLGDYEEDEVEPAPTRDPEAFLPKQGGLTDDVLERDMRVNDPSHEAKVDAGTFADELRGQSAEEAFSNISGLPIPVAEETDPRVARRKKRVNTKARVSAFTGHEEHTI